MSASVFKDKKVTKTVYRFFLVVCFLMKRSGSVNIIMDPGRPKTYDPDSEHCRDSLIYCNRGEWQLYSPNVIHCLPYHCTSPYLPFTSLLPLLEHYTSPTVRVLTKLTQIRDASICQSSPLWSPLPPFLFWPEKESKLISLGRDEPIPL